MRVLRWKISPVDGSAPAWAIPGGWGHVIVIQQFVGLREGRPYCPLRYVEVQSGQCYVDGQGLCQRRSCSAEQDARHQEQQGFSGSDED